MSKNRNTEPHLNMIRTAWDTYCENVVDPMISRGLPEDLKHILKTVFFTGAWSLHQLIHGISQDSVDPSHAIVVLKCVDDEMKAFEAESMKRCGLPS